jgi:hypothetical protein
MPYLCQPHVDKTLSPLNGLHYNYSPAARIPFRALQSVLHHHFAFISFAFKVLHFP